MLLDKHDTIGIDCVAMCVNDVICAGAKPLVFLDYIACGKNIPEKIAEIVKGVAEGCVQAGCSLVGGETAEHPGMMPEDEYDLAGFTVGVVDKAKILDNSTMQPGDVIIALPSTGVHSNGFSLVRKTFLTLQQPRCAEKDIRRHGQAPGRGPAGPTKIYVKPVLAVMDEITVKGVSHITGGGFYENIPRSLKKGCAARIAKADVRIPALFDVMQHEGGISEHDMFNTFNMGVGMVLTVAPEDADKAIAILKAHGEDAYRLGHHRRGRRGSSWYEACSGTGIGRRHEFTGPAGNASAAARTRIGKSRAGRCQQARRLRAGARRQFRCGIRCCQPQGLR